MVKFSCFQAQSPSQKHKKTVRQSSETMQKTLEDSSHNQALSSPSYLTKENNPCLKEEREQNYVSGHVRDFSPTASTKENNPCLKEKGEQNYVSGHAADFSPTASEEIEVKYITDNDNVVHKDGRFKKCQSLGSVLNWEQRISGDDGSQDETEQMFSYDGNKHRLGQSDKFPDPVPSDSVQVGSDFAKNKSMFSFGDPQPSEKDDADNDFYLPEDLTPRIRPGIVISTSLPELASPYRCSTSFVARSRSADDLNTLDSTKQGMNALEAGRQGQYQERDNNSVFNNDKNVENPGDETDYTYNYVGSAKEWIVPASDGEKRGKSIVSETSSKSAKDFRLKRIEEWVINLQNSGPTEESNDYDEGLSAGSAILGPTAMKAEVKVNPGMEAAKRYISSLNALATAAQLTNLGLVVIPFLSSFASLKALNLSGNSIGRVAAGALPRGLHVLNLSKNNISTIEGLRDLTRLRVLDLSYNKILRIGHGLAACGSLKELYLAGNKLSEVEGLHRLLKLNVLDLRFNKISTAKCVGQLAANYNSLQALSLEGNPVQKNVKDEQLKKHLQSLLPQLTYYNRQSIKFGTVKECLPRMGTGSHQVDRGLEVNVRKGTHGIVAQKVPKSQGVGRSRHGRLPPSGVKMSGAHGEIAKVGRGDFSFPRSRSEGNLGGL